MKLTRRDALAALAAAGIAVGAIDGSDVGAPLDGGNASTTLTDADVELLAATAEVLYPLAVEPTTTFVETYVAGRTAHDDEYERQVRVGLRYVNSHARRERGRAFDALPVGERDRVLRNLGLARATPRPDGTLVERTRYYVVNELLYSLYASPVGGRLLGNENPPGHPGGLAAYRRGPGDR